MSVTTEPVFDIAVSRDVGAPPDVLYGLITDLTKVGEHSPETISRVVDRGRHRPAILVPTSGVSSRK